MAERKISWPGQSGNIYEYWIYDLSVSHDEVAANYIFAKETKPNKFRPIYIGETDNLKERLSNHEKMPCIRENGATHICTHISPEDGEIRRTEEADLIRHWNPICNR